VAALQGIEGTPLVYKVAPRLAAEGVVSPASEPQLLPVREYRREACCSTELADEVGGEEPSPSSLVWPRCSWGSEALARLDCLLEIQTEGERQTKVSSYEIMGSRWAVLWPLAEGCSSD